MAMKVLFPFKEVRPPSVCPVVKITLPQPVAGMTYTIHRGPSLKNECEHEYVEVGFHFTKLVCKHCDKEKG